MKKLYKKFLYSFFLLSVIMAGNLAARVRTVQTEREFDQQLSKSNILMVLLYDNPGKKMDKAEQNFLNMYETISSRKIYDDADIIFTKINVQNDAMRTIKNRYRVAQTPCFMLFMKGKPVLDKTGKIAQLIGFVPEKELHAFIQQYCLNTINTLVNEKESNRKERFIKSQEESDPYFYPAVYYAPEYDFSWQKPLKYDGQGNEK